MRFPSRIALFAVAACTAVAGLSPAPRTHAQTRTLAGGSLVLYGAEGYDVTTGKAFGKATGTNVQVLDDHTGIIIAKIQAEGANPKWDVVWFDGDAAMQALNNQGLLYKWAPANVANYTPLGTSLTPPDHAFFPTGVTAAGTIVYNTHKLSPAQAPKDWSDLLKPQFKNNVAMSDPAYSGPAYSMIAGTLLRLGGTGRALTAGEAFYTALKNNGPIKFNQSNEPTLNQVETGARLVGIVQDATYFATKATGAPLAIVYPTSGVTVLPGVLAINAKSKHLQAAEAFVNYVLSRAGQNVMVHDPNDSDSYFSPIIKGVAALPGRQTAGINWQRLDYVWAGAHNAQIKAWFHTHIVQ